MYVVSVHDEGGGGVGGGGVRGGGVGIGVDPATSSLHWKDAATVMRLYCAWNRQCTMLVIWQILVAHNFQGQTYISTGHWYSKQKVWGTGRAHTLLVPAGHTHDAFVLYNFPS